MSSWKCSNCGLLNGKTIDKCIACFNYNHNKYWQCEKCDLINCAESTKCIACFNKHVIPPPFEIGDKWIRRYSHMKQDPDAKSISKLVKWNNKLYHIVITLNSENNFIISMYPIPSHNDSVQTAPAEDNTCPRCGQKGHKWCDPMDSLATCMDSLATCINNRNGELYVLVHITKSKYVFSDDDPNGPGGKRVVTGFEDYLIIYDLNMQKMKQQLLLNGDDFVKYDPISKSRTFIQNMCCIHNNNSYQAALSITIDIMDYWVRMASLSLPKDIYDAIHLFCTFLARKNVLQLLILTEDKEPSGPPYDHNRIYTRTIYHAVIDLDQVNEINLDITNNEVMEHCDACKFDQQRENPFLSLRINNDIYWIFNKWEGTWRISLDDGMFEKTEFMNPYPNETDGGFHGEFDKVMSNGFNAMNETERYLYILTQDDYNQPHFDLVAFDRQNQVFMMLKKNITSGNVSDMNLIDDHLYLLLLCNPVRTVIDALEFKIKHLII